MIFVSAIMRMIRSVRSDCGPLGHSWIYSHSLFDSEGDLLEWESVDEMIKLRKSGVAVVESWSPRKCQACGLEQQLW